MRGIKFTAEEAYVIFDVLSSELIEAEFCSPKGKKDSRYLFIKKLLKKFSPTSPEEIKGI